jgi:hypothetical protein
VTADKARILQYGLLKTYLGERYYSSDQPPSVRRELIEAAKPRTEKGSDLQRMAALALIANAVPEEAAAIGARLADDAALSDSLRTFAFQMQLLKGSSVEARKAAVEALKGSDVWRKKLAIKYLVHGPSAIFSISSGFFMSYSYSSSSSFSRDSTPIIPKPPEGVEAKQVRPWLADSDPEVAAGAGYMLALLGEPEGIEPLLRYWRQQQKTGGGDVNKLVYRAIAIGDDSKYIPILREIFAKLDKSDLYEFYWTIRIMSGPEILKFRKQVREAMKEKESNTISID